MSIDRRRKGSLSASRPYNDTQSVAVKNLLLVKKIIQWARVARFLPDPSINIALSMNGHIDLNQPCFDTNQRQSLNCSHNHGIPNVSAHCDDMEAIV
jgi:hypothetical protein